MEGPRQGRGPRGPTDLAAEITVHLGTSVARARWPPPWHEHSRSSGQVSWAAGPGQGSRVGLGKVQDALLRHIYLETVHLGSRPQPQHWELGLL